MEPFIGQIAIFAGDWVPRGWALCDGRTLQVRSNPQLFSVIGNAYGGDGRTTFALPDLRGRVPMHVGKGDGLSERKLGSSGGARDVTLQPNQIPSHRHQALGTADVASYSSPGDAVWAAQTPPPPSGKNFYRSGKPTAPMNLAAIAAVGGGAPHDNVQPYLPLTFIIALQGIFPTRA